ncbi:MAG: hypothetical protein U1F87_11235 [Kiritimatiellia bacterium]
MDWREPILTFAGVTLLGIGWAGVAWWYSPLFCMWISPVLLGLMLSIPFAIATSGPLFSRFFSVPEETAPPALLGDLAGNLARARESAPLLPELARHAGLMILLDPFVSAPHQPAAPAPQHVAPGRRYLSRLWRLIQSGPSALTRREIKALMYDPDVLLRLHYDLWSAGAADLSLVVRWPSASTTRPGQRASTGLAST